MIIASRMCGRHGGGMTFLATIVAAAALLLAAQTVAPGIDAVAGDTFELSQSYDTSSSGSNGSSSSSHGRTAILERVLAVGPEGVELEYDLPRSATEADRAREWQFPARMLRSPDGAMRLLNAADLSARLAIWLKKAKWDNSVCGRLIFTWNAFRIECDPQSVVATVANYDIGVIRPVDGGTYRDPAATAAGKLKKVSDSHFVVTMEIDPAVIRKERADVEIGVGEISGKPITLDVAMRNHAADAVSGTVTVTFDTDDLGIAWRQTREMKFDVRVGSVTETEVRTNTIVRRRLPIREVGVK